MKIVDKRMRSGMTRAEDLYTGETFTYMGCFYMRVKCECVGARVQYPYDSTVLAMNLKSGNIRTVPKGERVIRLNIRAEIVDEVPTAGAGEIGGPAPEAEKSQPRDRRCGDCRFFVGGRTDWTGYCTKLLQTTGKDCLACKEIES